MQQMSKSFKRIILGIIILMLIPNVLTISHSKLDGIDEIPRTSGLTPPIVIDGDSVDQNWEDCPWVNGSGTYADPYVLKDLTIDAGGIGSAISIRDSTQYFRIENCTMYNSGSEYNHAGIYLSRVENGEIIGNDCFDNGNGIMGWTCQNLTVSENKCNDNDDRGISFWSTSTQILVDSNECNENNMGIMFYDSSSNIIINNTRCRLNLV